MKEKFDIKKAKWQEEKKNISSIKEVKEEIDRIKYEIEMPKETMI